MSQLQSVIFDLDGTLVDSSAGIFASLQHAFSVNGVTLNTCLTTSLIGPPLRETVASLIGQHQIMLLDRIIKSFELHYDSLGYLDSSPYHGVDVMLQKLVANGTILAIATNKRSYPTELILSSLGWKSLFRWVYSPDSVQPSLNSKTDLLARMLLDTNLDPSCCLYVGDRAADWHSAKANGIRFAWADWGFSELAPLFNDDSIIMLQPQAHVIVRQWLQL